jgi:hypothetical protein
LDSFVIGILDAPRENAFMSDLVQTAVDVINRNPLLTLGGGIIFAALCWKNPKAMAKLAVIVLVFVALYGMVNLLGTVTITGIDNKTEMIEK